MASIYGVGVMNRYDLFVDDESDPVDVFKAMEQLREEKKKAKLADKEIDTATKSKVPPNKKVKAPSTAKAQDKKANGTKANAENNREKENRRGEFEEKPARGPSPRGENRRGKPLGARNAGRRNSDDRRGKREFDRQSGSDKTGVKPIDKREGGGSHNWGSHKDLIEEVEKASAEEPRVEEHPENGEKEPEETIEEELKQLTLEEWKASRANRAKPQYNLRKAGEGEDLTQWKKMYELNKKADRNDSEDEEYDPMDFPQRVGRQKHVREINFYFNDGRRGGAFRGRGGRGRRDGRQRDNNQSDGDQPPQTSAPAPRVDDERAFPSLG